MKILEFAIKGTEDYSKAQDKEMEDFEKIENLLTDTISNIESGNTGNINTPLTEADIGKYVNYQPQGTDYTAEAKYSGTAQLDSSREGYNVNQTFSQDTNLKWQIWKIENNTLYLISDKSPTTTGYNNTGNLMLTGTQGYNNGVTLLDNLCQSNYGITGNAQIKAKNLKLEDVLAVKAEDILPNNEDKYGKQVFTYPDKGTSNFPNIWFNNERGSLVEALGNRSKEYPLVELIDSTVSSSNQTPYHTEWGKGDINISSAWKSESYLNMIFPEPAPMKYWLSTRHVSTRTSSTLAFGLEHIDWRSITNSDLYYGGSNNQYSLTHSIRPLVQIPLTSCEITPSSIDGMDFEITIK